MFLIDEEVIQVLLPIGDYFTIKIIYLIVTRNLRQVNPWLRLGGVSIKT